jgi:hypothetical protein
MRLFKFHSRNSYIFALFFILITTSAQGSSAWQDQPRWAADQNSPSTPARKNSYSRDIGQRVFPFAPGSNNLALDVGQVFLMGDLGANYSDSIGSQLHYTFGVSDVFAFDSSIGYSDHSDGKFSMTTAVAGLRTNLAWYDKVVPYAVLGLGFYRPSYQINDTVGGQNVVNSVSPLLFGVHLGPGVDLELTRQLYFGAALTFHDVFSSSRAVSKGSISVGGTFMSFLLHAGVTF